MKIQIKCTSSSPVSTDLGILNPGQTLTATLPPNQASQAAINLTALSNKGLLTVTVLDDSTVLPVLQGSSGGGATSTATTFDSVAVTGTDGVELTNAGARVDFYTGDTSAYISRSATNKLYSPATMQVDGGVLTNTVGAATASSLSLFGAPTDASNAIGTLVGSSTALANASAKLLSVKNSGTEKLYVDKSGNMSTVGGVSVGANTSHVMVSIPTDTWIDFNGTAIGGGPSVGLQWNSGLSFLSSQQPVGVGTGSTNYIQIAGAATTAPVTLTALGGDSAVGIELIPKGAGDVSIPDGKIFSLSGPGSTAAYLQHAFGQTIMSGAINVAQAATIGGADVNSVYINGSTTGNPVTMQAVGSDTDVSIALTPKGAGGVQINGGVSQYKGVATAGSGVSPIVAYGTQAGTSTDGQTIASFTTASGGVFEVGGFLRCTAHSSGNVYLHVTGTDDANNAFDEILWGVDNTAGGVVEFLSASGHQLRCMPMTISVKAATTITMKTGFTGTATATYFAWVKQIN